MKVNRVSLLPLICGVGLLCAIFLSCGSTRAPIPAGISLETALREAVSDIEARQRPGTVTAVLNFASPSLELSDYLVEELNAALTRGGYMTVVDRDNLDLIRKELDFQLSGAVSDESAQRIGKMLGAELIVTGTFTDTGETYRWRTRTIRVETAAITAITAVDVVRDDKIRHLTKGATTVQDVLFPLYGVTPGKTTIEELERLGIKNTATLSTLDDSEGAPFKYYVVQGFRIWYDHNVATSLYQVHTEPLPQKWTAAGLSFEKSYNEWMVLARKFKWDIKVTQAPELRIWDGSECFSAIVEYSYISEWGHTIRIELNFNFSPGTKSADDRNTLYAIDVGVPESLTP